MRDEAMVITVREPGREDETWGVLKVSVGERRRAVPHM